MRARRRPAPCLTRPTRRRSPRSTRRPSWMARRPSRKWLPPKSLRQRHRPRRRLLPARRQPRRSRRSGPSEQPIDVVGEVKADQVASAADVRRWRRMVDADRLAAERSGRAVVLQDLSRRYGSVLDGREVNIVKAEIAGKGTFWRVRVPAGSRNDAISLCETLQGCRRQLLRLEVVPAHRRTDKRRGAGCAVFALRRTLRCEGCGAQPAGSR